MATRLREPTDEELADAERRLEEKRAIEVFEENLQRQRDRRPKGAARLSRTRAFRVSEPPHNRGVVAEFEDEVNPADPHAETPADQLRRANGTPHPADQQPPKPKPKKSRYDVPEVKNASTILKALGVLYVDERKKNPALAFQNLRDSIMLNLDLLLGAMPQIKQMFELLQIGEIAKTEESNSKEDKIAELTSGLRNFLQGV